MRFVTKRLRWIAAGAALAWFFDPVRGDERRARARSIGTECFRAGRRVGEQVSRRLPPPARGRATRLLGGLPPFARGPDDDLADQIRREVLEPAGAPQLLIEARAGHIVVRGALGDLGLVTELEDRIRRMAGVVSVELRVNTPSEGGLPPTVVRSQHDDPGAHRSQTG